MRMRLACTQNSTEVKLGKGYVIEWQTISCNVDEAFEVTTYK